MFSPRLDERPVMFARRKRCGFYCRPLTSPDRTGRNRALLAFPAQPCEICGKEPGGRGTVDRHHRDSDRLNNDPSNITFLCRRHHVAAHRASDGMIGGGARPRVAGLLRDRAVGQAMEAAGLVRSGMTYQEAAATMRVHPYTVRRWFRKSPEGKP